MPKYFNDKREQYEKIINILCEYKGINREKLFRILKDKECKYLFFLLIKKYGCDDMEMIQEDFPSVNSKNINSNVRKAKEKILLNRKIRSMYFEAENILEKIE
ncbi:ribose-5-phosphate isomerase [Clostridium sp. P21]|uniref:Ribose-5-phosphate isomerase n=1 Tax=Clostridium muellerianum TaxID=2716538 RepID=A0A7Y0EDU8_9CLOT|nr:ribose-5-phosphate isomerase [Clostridium muellerianum]